MEDFTVKLLLSDGINLDKETFTFKLEVKATILDLKEAFTKVEGYTPDQLRMIYRKPDFDMPLDDSDVLQDIEDQSGVFLIQCPSVSVGMLDGLVSITHDENVDVLVGTKKSFEHFQLKRLEGGDNLKIPLGKTKTKAYLHFSSIVF